MPRVRSQHTFIFLNTRINATYTWKRIWPQKSDPPKLLLFLSYNFQDDQCSMDYIGIAGSADTGNQSGVTGATTNRYCGMFLNTVVNGNNIAICGEQRKNEKKKTTFNCLIAAREVKEFRSCCCCYCCCCCCCCCCCFCCFKSTSGV